MWLPFGVRFASEAMATACRWRALERRRGAGPTLCKSKRSSGVPESLQPLLFVAIVSVWTCMVGPWLILKFSNEIRLSCFVIWCRGAHNPCL